MPSQGKIIRGLNRKLKKDRMPIVMNERGICNGLVMKYLIAAGKKKKKEFFQDLNFMADLHSAQYQENETRIKLFCRDVEYAFLPEKYRTDARQSNLEVISETFLFPTQNTYALSYAFTPDSLASAINDTVHEGDLIHLGALGHATGLHKENGKFYLYDPSGHQDEKMFNNSTELAQEMFLQFARDKQHPPTMLPLTLSIYREKVADVTKGETVNYPNKSALIEKLFKIDHNKVDNNKQRELTLLKATQTSDVETVRVLLEKGVNPHVNDEYEISAFIYAAKYATPAVLDLMYVNPHFPITQAQTEHAIANAVSTGNIAVFQHLLTKLDKHNLRDFIIKYKLIYYASTTPLSGMLVAVMSYLNSSEDDKLLVQKYGETAGEQKTPLEWAAEKGYPAVVSLLLSKPIVKQAIESLCAAARVAIVNGHESIAVQILGHLSADTNFNEYLSLAVSRDRKWVMEKLLDKVEFQNVYKQIRPLIDANNYELLDVLLQNLIRRNSPPEYIKLLILLHAVIQGKFEEVQITLEKEPALLENDLFVAGDLLRLACATGNDKAVRGLLSIDAFKQELKPPRGQMFITEQCEQGHQKVVQTLCPNALYTPNDPTTPTMMKRAISENNIDVVNSLIFAGMEPLTIIDDNKNAIELAIQYHSETLIKSLLTNISKDVLKPKVPKNLLLEKLLVAACRFGYKDLLNDLLVKFNVPINMAIEFNGNTYTPLELAALSEQRGTCAILLNRGADINQGTNTKPLLLLLAIKYGELGTIEELISRGYRIPELLDSDNKQINVYSHAMENYQPEVIRLLLKQGVLLSRKSAVLSWACANGFTDLAEDLVKFKLDLTKPEIDELIRIWHECCQNNKVNHLLKLHQVMTRFIPAQQLAHYIKNGIMSAIHSGKIETVKVLSQLIAHDKTTMSELLDVATTAHQPGIADFLLHAGAQYKADAPLDTLMSNAYQHQLVSLQEKSLTAKSAFHPLLQIAYEQGHIHIFLLLLTKTDIDKNSQQKLPHDLAALSAHLLEMASKREETAIVLRLLKCGAKFDKTSAHALNIFSRACITGDEELVTLLLKSELNLLKPFATYDPITSNNSIENLDPNPIQLAALYGHRNIVRLLLQNYADTLKWNTKKVLELAIESYDWRLASAILEQMSNTDLTPEGLKLLLSHQEQLKDEFIQIMEGSFKEARSKQDATQENDLISRIKAVSNNLNALGKVLHHSTFPEHSPYRDDFGLPITKHIADLRIKLSELSQPKAVMALQLPSLH